jgi:tryptophan synthase beta subunit
LDETSLTAQSVNNLKNYAEANKTIVSSKNRLTSTQAGELIAAYSISTGLDFNTLAGLFNYNDSDSTFSLPEAVTTHDLQYKALEILAKTDEDVAAILAKYKQDYTKIVKALDEENITEGLNIVGSTEAFEEIIKST